MRDLEIPMSFPPPIASVRILSGLALVVLTAACPTRDEIGHGAGDGGEQPDGSGDGGEQPDGGGTPAIAIVSPGSMSYVTGTVQVEVSVTGGTTTTVQLLRDDMPWQMLSGPPFTYSWDTTGDPDSDHILTAKATVSGQPVTSQPVTVSVDNTPPRVTLLTPSRGSNSVSLRDAITVTFSEPVLASSVSDTSVQLAAGGSPVASTVTLAANAQSLAVTVTNPKGLTLPADFTAMVATTITDRAGNALTAVDPPWTWSVPAWIKLPPLATQMPPRLAVDPMGRPLLIYVTLETVTGNSVFNLRLARFEAGAWNTSTFGAPTTDVDTARNGYSMTLDSKGQPVLAWTASVPAFSGFPKVYVGAWTGSTWNTQFPALDAVTGTGRDPSFPSVRVDMNDEPVVAWRENTGNFPTCDAYVARWTGTAWMPLAGTGFMGGAGFSQLMDGPQLVLDPQGNPTFGWIEGGGVGSGLSFWTGTTWMRSQPISGTFTPYPALDSTGAPLIATRNADLHVLKWDSSLPNWTEPFMPALTTSSSWLGPRLALAADGSPVVAWTDTSSGVRIGVARWNAGAWDTRFGLFNGGQNPPNNIVPELVVDAGGSIWVAWQEGTAAQVWMSNY
jgi:hypothetical protein